MIYNRGDIATIYFPHSDLHTVKLRPDLFVQADDLRTSLDQLVVAMISSNMQQGNRPSRVTVLLGDPISRGTGLKLDSVILTDNLATIELAQFKSKVGVFTAMHLADVALAHTLGLESANPFGQ